MNGYEIVHNGIRLEYRVVKSKRKSAAIQIEGNGTIVVRVPSDMRVSDIKALVSDKGQWIEKSLESLKNKESCGLPASFHDGDRILYRGQNYHIQVVEDRNLPNTDISIDSTDGTITVRTYDGGTAVVRGALLGWYYHGAQQEIKKSLEFYSHYFSEQISVIHIRDQKTIWGSCSSKGNLNFNWKLILLPPELLDYVVVHELCHLKEMNHSKRFWNQVETILPDYRIKRKQLHDYSL